MRNDLAVLVPCLDILVSTKASLNRSGALGIRPITFGIDKHIYKDSGCFLTGPDLLRTRLKQVEHALIVFDRHGCGQEQRAATDPADDTAQDLRPMAGETVPMRSVSIQNWRRGCGAYHLTSSQRSDGMAGGMNWQRFWSSAACGFRGPISRIARKKRWKPPCERPGGQCHRRSMNSWPPRRVFTVAPTHHSSACAPYSRRGFQPESDQLLV